MRKKRGISTRALIAVLALTLLIGCSLGGTMAWLMDKTDSVTNTFTVGNIKIGLTETTTEYKIVPGVDIAKDPKVTVEAKSEACWLFVKVEETNWPTYEEDDGTRKVSYAIAEGWTPLTGETGVYYRQVAAADTDQDFYVLAGNKVTVSDNLTKAEINAIATTPTLRFTAYAVQQEGMADDAAAAWAAANSQT